MVSHTPDSIIYDRETSTINNDEEVYKNFIIFTTKYVPICIVILPFIRFNESLQ